MVICLERSADLHMAQMMPLPLTVSCFTKIQIGFTFLVPAHTGSPGKRAVKRVSMCCLYKYKGVNLLRGLGALHAMAKPQGRSGGVALLGRSTRNDLTVHNNSILNTAQHFQLVTVPSTPINCNIDFSTINCTTNHKLLGAP